MAFHHLVDKAVLQGLLGIYGLASVDHLFGTGHADEPLQPLGAAVAGQCAEGDFRQAELGVGSGDTQIAAHGQLTAAAQGIASDSGDDYFAHSLKLAEHCVGFHGAHIHS